MRYIEHVAEVHSRISPYILDTPVRISDHFSAKTGSTVVFKCDNMQHTGAFKVRGVFSKLTAMHDKNRVLVAMSGGNHGRAVAYAAEHFGMEAIIFVPEFVPERSRDLIREHRAELIVHGKNLDETERELKKYLRDPKYTYIHPFDDKDVIAGQATVAHELLRSVPDIDAIVVSIGGGGLISGIAQYAKDFNPNIKIYGVETEGADAMSRSLAAGRVVPLHEITSIAITLGATRVAQITFDVVRDKVEKVVTVTDQEALISLKEVLNEEQVLLEPAASCSIAALVSGKLPDMKGMKVAVILCGANFSLEQLKQHLRD